MFAYKYITNKKLFVPFYLFFIWIIFLMTLSKEFLYSFKAVSQVVFSISTFIVSYNYFNSKEKLDKLLGSLFWVLFIAIVATSMGYIFGIGHEFDYLTKKDTESDVIGLLGSSGLYSPGIIISLIPLIIKSNLRKYQKLLLPVMVIVLFIFILLTIRRTVILIPLIGMLGYFLYTRRKLRFLRLVIFAVIVFIISFPLFADLLFSRFEKRARTGRFEEDFYKTEMRYVENVELFNQLIHFREPAKIIFGLGNNIFAENITDNEITSRMYHTDIAKLLYGVGLFGLFIYIWIYINIYKKIRSIPNDKIYSDYKAALIGLFLISVFVSINGSITIITFRSINFLLLGAILGYMKYSLIFDNPIYIKNKPII
jgi:hypothetical protein